jgi:hypothetical protein
MFKNTSNDLNDWATKKGQKNIYSSDLLNSK